MRRSKAITLTTLGAAVLAAGCGKKAPPAPAPVAAAGPSFPSNGVDFTWYDAIGNEIPETWTINHKGKIVPLDHPHDSDGQPWVWSPDGDLFPLAAAIPHNATGPAGPPTSPEGMASNTTRSTGQTTTYHRSPMIVPIFLGSMAMGGRSAPPPGFRPSPNMSGRPSNFNPSRPAGVSSGGFGGSGGSMGGGSSGG